MTAQRFYAAVAPILVVAIVAFLSAWASPAPHSVVGGRGDPPPDKAFDCEQNCSDAGGTCDPGSLCVASMGYCYESSVVASSRCTAGDVFTTCNNPGGGNCQTKYMGAADPKTGSCYCLTPVSYCGVKTVCTGS